MISPETVKQLAQSPEKQCLTLYFNTSPHDRRSAWLTRFKGLVRNLNGGVPTRERRAFDAAVERAGNFLRQYEPKGNSFFACATRSEWQQFASRVPVRDELTWGRPNVSQLLWLLEEYRPYGVIFADREHVRFLAVRMNEFEDYREFAAEIDTRAWRKQATAASGGGKGRARSVVDATAFDARYMEQIRRFWRTVQKPLAELLDRYHVRRIVLAGNKSLLPEFAKTLSPALAGAVVTQIGIEAFTTPADAVKKIYPEILKWENERDARLVASLLDSASISRRAAVGVEPVLRLVREGRVARVLIARDFDRPLTECDCGSLSEASARTCPQCDTGAPRKTTLTAALPRLVLAGNVTFDIIKGRPGEELAKNGGLGAFLRF